MKSVVAKIIVHIRAKSLDKLFDYLVPLALHEEVKRGHRVLISFGRQLCQGFVLELTEVPDTEGLHDRLKPVLSTLDETPILTEGLLQLCEWLTDRYVCTRLEAIQTIVPGAFSLTFRELYQQTVIPVPDDAAPGVLRVVSALRKGPATLEQLSARLGPDGLVDLRQATALGLVEEVVVGRDRVREKTMSFLTPLQSCEKLADAARERRARAPKQARLLEDVMAVCDVSRNGGTLQDASRMDDSDYPMTFSLAQLGYRASDGAVRALVRDGLVRLEERKVDRTVQRIPDLGGKHFRSKPQLTSWQSRALRAIEQARLETKGSQVVLHGVTGSGKTEVYLRTIEEVLNRGQSAIVLVPEISLTPQMVERFTMRFGSLVSVLHSALSPGERRDGWMRLRTGEARVVVGARSAIFAPVEHLGLVIVDEEHEPSYKQEETPYYDAREVAIWRAEHAGAMVVFGSATPSLEAMARVERGQAVMAMLPERVNGCAMPPVEVVDMREELRDGNRSLFSRAMEMGLSECVRDGHQAILFLNRRGYSAFLLCRNCGERVMCPQCDISLTLHRSRTGEWLQCHYCQYTAPVTTICSACGTSAMRPFGVGTQQIEEYLREHWPAWRVLRMDVDTTRRKGAHQDIISRFSRGEAEILLGTQMVAKGLDFPNVAFVGVITADTMLAVPDYRANERTFDLLTQVAGRSGRAEVPGKTVIQTYQPEHYAIRASAHHDYATFYERERTAREAFGYPPFRELAVFMATHEDKALAQGAAKRFERELRRRIGDGNASVLSAVPSSVGRVENRFRFQVVVKYLQWADVKSDIRAAYQVVAEKMRKLNGNCILDVQAGRV